MRRKRRPKQPRLKLKSEEIADQLLSDITETGKALGRVSGGLKRWQAVSILEYATVQSQIEALRAQLEAKICPHCGQPYDDGTDSNSAQ